MLPDGIMHGMQQEVYAMYSFLLAIIYISFVSLGLPDALLGAAWPIMHTEFSVPVSYMGILSISRKVIILFFLD